jgi:hypothetical protein
MEKTHLNAPVTANPIWPDLGLNPGCCGKEPKTDHLKCGTAWSRFTSLRQVHLYLFQLSHCCLHDKAYENRNRHLFVQLSRREQIGMAAKGWWCPTIRRVLSFGGMHGLEGAVWDARLPVAVSRSRASKEGPLRGGSVLVRVKNWLSRRRIGLASRTGSQKEEGSCSGTLVRVQPSSGEDSTDPAERRTR